MKKNLQLSIIWSMYKFLILALVSLSFPLQIFADGLNVKTTAKAAILVNAENGAIIYGKNENLSVYPASLTKIATALYALKMKKNLEAMVPAPRNCLRKITPKAKRVNNYSDPHYILETDGTHYRILGEEVLSFSSLIYGLMLVSGNDAANTIAHHVSGNIPLFMKELNSYLKELGCQSTHFCNPHGLHIPSHQTTASDLALISRQALKNSFFREVISTLEYERPETNKQSSMKIMQRNRLLKEGNFYYSGAVGMKTGYTAAAGHNLVAVASKNGRKLIAVILGCKTSNERYRDAIHLFDAAFAESKVSRKLFSEGDLTFKKTIKGGKKPLLASISSVVFIEYYPSEEPQLKTELTWYESTSPITKHEKVGVVSVYTDSGILLADVEIEAVADVNATILQMIKNFWNNGERVKLFIIISPVVMICLGGICFIRKTDKM